MKKLIIILFIYINHEKGNILLIVRANYIIRTLECVHICDKFFSYKATSNDASLAITNAVLLAFIVGRAKLNGSIKTFSTSSRKNSRLT